MGNTLLTPTVIAKEGLIVLENEMVLAGLVHRDYSKEFQNVGATVLIRKPTTFTSNTVGDTVNLCTAVESSVAVVLDKLLDITFRVTSKELTLDVADFSMQFIQPVMRAHAQKVDEIIADLYSDVAAHYPVSSTALPKDITSIRSVMSILKAPLDQRRLVFHPSTEADYLSLDAFLHAEKRGDTRAIKEASMGRVLGFDCYMDQNIPTHTAGDLTGGGTATVVLKGAGASAGTCCTVDASLDTGTALIGDVFKVLGYDQWHVVKTCTSTVGTAILTFQPAFTAARVDNATVTFQETHKANLAFHRNAFAFVTAPLEPPIGGAKGGVLTYKGLSCRVVYDYESLSKKNIISIDMLCGAKILERDLAARLSDAN